jgi:Uma2 family endonuclease
MSTATLITAEEFIAMSFDRPVELVRGEIVEMTNPGYRHGNLCFRLALIIGRWLESHAEFDVATNDTGVLIEVDPDTVRGPDLMILRKSKLPGGRGPVGHLTIPPEVAVEIRSPSDRSNDVMRKVALFLAAGVAEVWVIEPDHQRVFIHRDNEETTVFQGSDIVTSPQLPGLECPLAKLFEGIA